MKKKGYYITKKENELILNIYSEDFVNYLNDIPKFKGWIKFRIYERESVASNGLTHDMRLINNNNTENG